MLFFVTKCISYGFVSNCCFFFGVKYCLPLTHEKAVGGSWNQAGLTWSN